MWLVSKARGCVLAAVWRPAHLLPDRVCHAGELLRRQQAHTGGVAGAGAIRKSIDLNGMWAGCWQGGMRSGGAKERAQLPGRKLKQACTPTV